MVGFGLGAKSVLAIADKQQKATLWSSLVDTIAEHPAVEFRSPIFIMDFLLDCLVFHSDAQCLWNALSSQALTTRTGMTLLDAESRQREFVRRVVKYTVGSEVLKFQEAVDRHRRIQIKEIYGVPLKCIFKVLFIFHPGSTPYPICFFYF